MSASEIASVRLCGTLDLLRKSSKNNNVSYDRQDTLHISTTSETIDEGPNEMKSKVRL